MAIMNAFAGLAVRDLAASKQWYEALLGPGRQPMPEVVEWQFKRGGALQVYAGPERAGQGSCTLIVNDIDEIARQLDALRLTDQARPTRTAIVDTLMIKDPDGNSIAFSMPKDPSLAQ